MPNDGNFCGDGLVYGNGEITPKMQEVKRNYQNIEAVITRTTARILNRSLFTNTSEFDCVVLLERNGVRIAEAKLETSVAPMCEKEAPLPFPEQHMDGEYAVTLSFRLKRAAAWADAGYEIAFAQGIYKVAGAPAQRRFAPLKIVRGDWNFGVKGESFEALFSRIGGGLVSYKYCGREMLKGVPMPNFWRAPTDNDRGNFMAQRYAQWKLASLYATHRFPQETAARNNTDSAWLGDDGSAAFRMIYALPTSPAAECAVRYTVHPSGRIDVRLEYDPVPGLLEMPEFGMLLRMDADYDRVRWYGFGPDANYVDRRAGARLGIWKGTVQENLAHYLVPQECGNRTGVRWVEATDARGHGLRFIGDSMEFSALPYTPHELENALHEYELPPVNYTVIRCTKMQMGVGGDDSWGAKTHVRYLLDISGKLYFDFSFEGIP